MKYKKKQITKKESLSKVDDKFHDLKKKALSNVHSLTES